jgi:putative flippase GtrA
MKKKIKQAYDAAKHSKKIKFGLVGVINTIVDFSILNILVHFFGFTLIPANIVSTTCAMLTSFTLNKTAVFPEAGRDHIRQLVLFFAVTLTGVWLVQTGVMFGVYQLLDPLVSWPSAILLNIAKIVGIGVGLVWNYMWYSRVVFRMHDGQGK